MYQNNMQEEQKISRTEQIIQVSIFFSIIYSIC